MKKNEDVKEIYFLILYKRKEKEEENSFIFINNDSKPKNIYTNEIKYEGEGEGQNKIYLYEKVFKYNKNLNNEDENEKIEIQFEIDEDMYIILFNIEDTIFYYDIILKKSNKFQANIAKEIIDQNIFDYYKKFELFLEALKKNNEEEKIDTLYEESIKLASNKKGFYLMISLFVKIFNKKNLCIKLINEFYQISINKKNEKNLYRTECLNNYISAFSNISSEADNLIQNNGYDAIKFYGIILCYLNYCDYENFKKYFIKLYRDEYKVLYEILLAYDSNLLNPIFKI